MSKKEVMYNIRSLFRKGNAIQTLKPKPWVLFSLTVFWSFININAIAQYCIGESTTIYLARSIGCGGGLGSNAMWDGAEGGNIGDPGGLSTEVSVTWTTTGTFRLKRTFSGCGVSAVYSNYFTILASPSAPLSTQLSQQPGICNEVILSYTGTNNSVYWQTSATGKDLTYLTTRTVTSTGNFYARTKGSNGCFSPGRLITVSSLPGPPPVGGQLTGTGTYIGYINQNLEVTNYSGTIKEYWYRDNGGENIRINNTTDKVHALYENDGNTTLIREYWAVVERSGCVTNSESAILTITPFHSTSFPNIIYTCSENSSALTLTSDLETDRWYLSSSGGTPISETNIIQVSFIETTYYIERAIGDGQFYRMPYTVDETFTERCGNALNFIKHFKPQTPLNALTLSETALQVQKSISYFDGVGKSVQSVAISNSASEKDIVEPIVYDLSDRIYRRYLPFVSEDSDGSFKDVSFAEDGNYNHGFYEDPSDKIADDSRPFTETVFEQSPLGRPLKQFGVGLDWKVTDKPIQYSYLVNSHGINAGQEQIIAWELNTDGIPVRRSPVPGNIEAGGYYSSNQIRINSVIDEQGHEVREYIDSDGKIVLKKVYVNGDNTDLNTSGNWAETYYVYDDFGNLVLVLPPEATKAILEEFD